MIDYMVEIFDNNENLIKFYTKSADGYCAEIEARKNYPYSNYKLGNVIRVESDEK